MPPRPWPPLYFRAGQLEAARSWCDKALERDERQLDALQTRVRACLALGDLDCATASSDKALATKATTDTYYLHGLARMAARDLTTAEKDFQQVIDWNHVYEEAYIALAEVQLKLYEGYEGPTMKMRTLDKAVEETSTALELNPQSIPALKTRSRPMRSNRTMPRRSRTSAGWWPWRYRYGGLSDAGGILPRLRAVPERHQRPEPGAGGES